MGGLISIKDIVFIVKVLPTKKNFSFTREFYLKKIKYEFYTNSFQK